MEDRKPSSTEDHRVVPFSTAFLSKSPQKFVPSVIVEHTIVEILARVQFEEAAWGSMFCTDDAPQLSVHGLVSDLPLHSSLKKIISDTSSARKSVSRDVLFYCLGFTQLVSCYGWEPHKVNNCTDKKAIGTREKDSRRCPIRYFTVWVGVKRLHATPDVHNPVHEAMEPMQMSIWAKEVIKKSMEETTKKENQMTRTEVTRS